MYWVMMRSCGRDMGPWNDRCPWNRGPFEDTDDPQLDLCWSFAVPSRCMTSRTDASLVAFKRSPGFELVVHKTTEHVFVTEVGYMYHWLSAAFSSTDFQEHRVAVCAHLSVSLLPHWFHTHSPQDSYSVPASVLNAQADSADCLLVWMVVGSCSSQTPSQFVFLLFSPKCFLICIFALLHYSFESFSHQFPNSENFYYCLLA